MIDFKRLPYASLLALSLVLVLLPAHAIAQPGEIQVTIDAPSTGVSLVNGVPLEIRGWVVDTSSAEGTGIESVEISLDSQNGVASPPMFAKYGNARPDVAQGYGRADWAPSGFSFSWTPEGVPDGEYTIRVWGHSPSGVSRFSSVTISLLTVRPVDARNVPTPMPTAQTGPIRVLDPSQRLACSMDLTLIAPSTFSQRPCPGQATATPSPSR